MPYIVTYPNIPPVDSEDFAQWLQVWHEVDQETRHLQTYRNMRAAVREVAARSGGGKRKADPAPVPTPAPVEIIPQTPVIVRAPQIRKAKVIRQPAPKPERSPKIVRARTPKPDPEPKKARQRLDIDVVKRAKVTPVQMCGTCRQAPALGHGYCESCWQMWLSRHKAQETHHVEVDACVDPQG